MRKAEGRVGGRLMPVDPLRAPSLICIMTKG
jgi:hypothetical protein